MKTTELRLGNWVIINHPEGSFVGQVDGIDHGGIWYFGDKIKAGFIDEKHIQPIPLDEQMKFHGTRNLGGRLRPEYLHDLQNLYFVTCRAELELNPEAVKAYVDTLKAESK